MIQSRRGALESRVDRLEARLVDIMMPPAVDRPLSRVEVAELRALQDDYRARFPGEIDDWPEPVLNDFLAYHCACDGAAARLDHLADRARSPEERATNRALAVAIDSMDLDQLDLFMAEMAAAHG